MDAIHKDWRIPVMAYMRDPNSPANRKLWLRAMNFVICGENLYKKGMDGTLLKCLDDSELFIALIEVHDGIYGAHQARDKMKLILNNYNYYWPSMIKYCYQYANSFQDCQNHGHIQQVPASELHYIIKPWKFRGWSLHLIGWINPTFSKQHQNILVGFDYFTK